ncbi:unnamed protein product, partial [Closterium sp. NIES-53]
TDDTQRMMAMQMGGVGADPTKVRLSVALPDGCRWVQCGGRRPYQDYALFVPAYDIQT